MLDQDGETALMMATRDGDFDLVRYLIDYGIDVNAKGVRFLGVRWRKIDIVLSDRNGNTALLKAAQNGHLDIVKYLTEHGADVDAKGSAIHWI
jgi:ankyrin repeat protein